MATLAARLIESNHPDGRRSVNHSDDEDDDEALFAELEAEIENSDDAETRERGLDALRREMQRLSEMRKNEHGRYTEIMDEKEVIRVSADEPRCVIHFYHTNFKRCQIMDGHLTKLAPRYFSTLFIRVFVENVPWLVERLGIKVLPCVICFVDGVSKDKLIGFEQLGNSDEFDTGVLELRLFMCGAVLKSEGNSSPLYKVALNRQVDDDSDVFDLDD